MRLTKNDRDFPSRAEKELSPSFSSLAFSLAMIFLSIRLSRVEIPRTKFLAVLIERTKKILLSPLAFSNFSFIAPTYFDWASASQKFNPPPLPLVTFSLANFFTHSLLVTQLRPIFFPFNFPWRQRMPK
ncbi:MAG: hypothetical protein WCV59_00140 [Parcubacteria group bacterium]